VLRRELQIAATRISIRDSNPVYFDLSRAPIALLDWLRCALRKPLSSTSPPWTIRSSYCSFRARTWATFHAFKKGLHSPGMRQTFLAAEQEKLILNMHRELDRYLALVE